MGTRPRDTMHPAHHRFPDHHGQTVKARSHRKVSVHHFTVTDPSGESKQIQHIRVDTYSYRNGARGDNTKPFRLGEEWLTGLGPRKHIFGDDDPTTNLLRKHDHVRALVQDVCSKLRSGIVPLPSNDDYSLSGASGIPKYIQDYSTVLDGGRTGNLAVTYLGSYELNYKVGLYDAKNRRAELWIHVSNTSTIQSATHPPLIGYTPQWKKHIGDPLNRTFRKGPLSLTRQDFYWTEYLDLSKTACE